MNTDMKTHIVSLLESYLVRERQIALLHYEIQHTARISPEDMIDTMSLGHGGCVLSALRNKIISCRHLVFAL